jgi:hypothetical protein
MWQEPDPNPVEWRDFAGNVGMLMKGAAFFSGDRRYKFECMKRNQPVLPPLFKGGINFF